MSHSIGKWLMSLSEEEFYPFLIDLLRAMGYQQVHKTHGTHELGKDICFLETDKLDRDVWRGIQVKAKPLDGSMSTALSTRGVLNQCQAALDTPYRTPNGEEAKLSEIWLVSTHPITEQAKQSIMGLTQSLNSVHIVDHAKLVDLLRKHLPELAEGGNRPVERYLQRLIDFCNSPEEYLAIRLGSRYSLSEVFVKLRARVGIVNPTYIANLDIHQAIALRLDSVAELATLIQEEVLPTEEFLNFIDLASHISAFLTLSASDDKDPTQVDKAHECMAQFVAAVVGFDLDPRVVPRPSVLSDLYSPRRVSSSEIAEYEAFLRNHQGPATECLRELRRIQLEIGHQQSTQEQIRKAMNYGKSRRRAEARSDFEDVQVYLESLRHSLPQREREREVLLGQLSAAFHQPRISPRRLRNLTAELSRKMCTFADPCPLDPALLSALKGLIQQRMEPFVKHYIDCAQQMREALPDSESTDQWSEKLIGSLAHLNQITGIVRIFCEVPAEQIIWYQGDAITFCESLKKAVIVGDLGVGKTTLAKQLAFRSGAYKDRNNDGLVPFFVSLAALPQQWPDCPSIDLRQYAQGYTHTLGDIDSHGLEWYLDGVDEMGSAMGPRELLAWCTSEASGPERAFVTSRPGILPQFVKGFVIAELDRLSDSQVQAFISEFPWNSNERRNALLSAIRKTESLAVFARTPLLLMLMVVVAKHCPIHDLPRRIDEVYDGIIQLLLGEWDMAKGITRSHSINDPALRRGILARIAHRLYEKQQVAFDSEQFLMLAVSAAPAEPLQITVAEKFFEELVRDCILSRRSNNAFTFFHVSLQEYLAAWDLSRQMADDQISQVLDEYLATHGERWHMVLLFLASIKRDVGPLLPLLDRSGSGIVDTATLTKLLRGWVRLADFTSFADFVPNGPMRHAYRELGIDTGKGVVDLRSRLRRQHTLLWE